jgi:DNA-binding transcriptional LysR family regulator
MRAYPEVELDLDFTDRLVDVIDEGFDAVVRAGEVGDSRLMARRLGTFSLVLVGSPDYFARKGIPRRPSDLKNHACLQHRFATSGKFERWPLRRDRKDIELPSTAAVNTIEPLIYMVLQGLGIACLPDFAVRDQLERGTLVTVLDSHVHHSGVFRILWPSSRYLSPKLRGFVDFMVQNLLASAKASNVSKPDKDSGDHRRIAAAERSRRHV